MSVFRFYDKKEQEKNDGIMYMTPQLFGGYFPHPYMDVVDPYMYLDFCLEDIKHNDKRSLTNAFSNCKKAIQLRILPEQRLHSMVFQFGAVLLMWIAILLTIQVTYSSRTLTATPSERLTARQVLLLQ